MTDGLICDLLNPRFVVLSPVFRDELGPDQILDASRLAYHVDRAIEAWYASNRTQRKIAEALDPASLVRDTNIEILNPINAPMTVRIDLWVEQLEKSTCVYGFLVSNEDGTVPFARGERTVIHIDPRSRSLQPWSTGFVASHSDLLKDLPAYA